MKFKTFMKMITNNNQMYAEEGSYKGIHVFDCGDTFIQFIEMNNDVEVNTYHIVEPYLDEFLSKIEAKYIEEGGDELHESIENWILDEEMIKEVHSLIDFH